MELNIETTTKICCNIVSDFNQHMIQNIPDIKEQFPDMADNEILYMLLQRTMEVFEQNENSLWN